MAARLGQHAFPRINENNGQFCGRSTRNHVARILLVTGRIGHDKLALFRGKETIGHVDGNPLLALGGKPVYQQRKVDFLALRALRFAPKSFREKICCWPC